MIICFIKELLQLHDEVYRLATTWYSFIPETQKNRILEIYGIGELPLPEADIQTGILFNYNIIGLVCGGCQEIN
jgi:hypothetical protein